MILIRKLFLFRFILLANIYILLNIGQSSIQVESTPYVTKNLATIEKNIEIISNTSKKSFSHNKFSILNLSTINLKNYLSSDKINYNLIYQFYFNSL